MLEQNQTTFRELKGSPPPCVSTGVFCLFCTAILYRQENPAFALLEDVTETIVTIELRKARPRGLEPPTTGSTVRYSNQLSYGPSDST